MRGQAAELDRGSDSVARGPRVLRATHAAVLPGEDEALLVARQAVERRTHDPRNREDSLDIEAIAAGLEHQTVAVGARHGTRLDIDTGPGQLLGERPGGMLAE